MVDKGDGRMVDVMDGGERWWMVDIGAKCWIEMVDGGYR